MISLSELLRQNASPDTSTLNYVKKIDGLRHCKLSSLTGRDIKWHTTNMPSSAGRRGRGGWWFSECVTWTRIQGQSPLLLGIYTPQDHLQSFLRHPNDPAPGARAWLKVLVQQEPIRDSSHPWREVVPRMAIERDWLGIFSTTCSVILFLFAIAVLYVDHAQLLV